MLVSTDTKKNCVVFVRRFALFCIFGRGHALGRTRYNLTAKAKHAATALARKKAADAGTGAAARKQARAAATALTPSAPAAADAASRLLAQLLPSKQVHRRFQNSSPTREATLPPKANGV